MAEQDLGNFRDSQVGNYSKLENSKRKLSDSYETLIWLPVLELKVDEFPASTRFAAAAGGAVDSRQLVS
ncbi:hypothetical protein MIMGU_mgv1a017549mg [Erythranthe guttata]|uniref:Uncharacterized protein n=1 Tax=Erythranthe guttata TaxID=4155 RepID=A0A022Q2X8_ERYGU|nr:hypothetical protein MIMGU_mgv1a017549mg [Erythranthe guttata]